MDSSEREISQVLSIRSESSASEPSSPSKMSSSSFIESPAPSGNFNSGLSLAPQNPFASVTAVSHPDSIPTVPSNEIRTTLSDVSSVPPLSPMRTERIVMTEVSSPSLTVRSVVASHQQDELILMSTPKDQTLPRAPQSAPVHSLSTPFTSTQSHAITELRRPEAHLPPRIRTYDDDDNTEPSSAINSMDPRDSSTPPAPSPFTRILQQTRRHLSSTKDSEVADMIEGALICGYLQKLGRNGKWQMRWFETDGECLSYYKSSKRTKLLATLDLEKVGDILVDQGDSKGCSFSIQVLGRLYHLRAESRASCKDWVITLNRVKEARLQQGNVKLVDPAFPRPLDLLDPTQDIVAPRIVVVANRERTRAVDEAQEWDQIMNRDVASPDANNGEMKRRTAIGNVVLARWSKRKTTINRLSAKLARWARSMRAYGCGNAESVQLDQHVHPPGHANSYKPKVSPLKPETVVRGVSDVSEDGARYLS